MKASVVKFPQIVAEALAKADCALAGEVYQAIMAHELFGTEPTGLSAAADALYTLCMQFVKQPVRRPAKKAQPESAPTAAESASPAVPETIAPISETPPPIAAAAQVPQVVPEPIFPDLTAPRVTTLQSAPRPASREPKAPERRQRYLNRIRGKAKRQQQPVRIKIKERKPGGSRSLIKVYR